MYFRMGDLVVVDGNKVPSVAAVARQAPYALGRILRLYVAGTCDVALQGFGRKRVVVRQVDVAGLRPLVETWGNAGQPPRAQVRFRVEGNAEYWVRHTWGATPDGSRDHPLKFPSYEEAAEFLLACGLSRR